MTGLLAKVMRRVARHTDKSLLPSLQKSIVTFGFDDCPKSAITTGLPLLEAEGWRATIYVACGLCDTTNHLGLHMSEADIVDVHARGHEIADHTFSHLSANEVGLDEFLDDIEKNQSALERLGVPRSRHFAYPYGHVSPAIKKELRKKFETLRGVVAPSGPLQDSNLLSAVRIYSNDSIEFALEQIKRAQSNPVWLNLFTHDLGETPSEYGCTPDDFKRIIDAVIKARLSVMTVDKAYETILESELTS